MIRVRILKVLFVVVPIVLFVLVLRGLGESCRQHGLPDGYSLVSESERWRVYGPIGDEAIASVGPDLDAFLARFRATYAEPFRITASREPLDVYVFRSRAAFREYARADLTDDTARVVGYYWPGGFKIAAVASAGRGEQTLRHEAVHAILHREVAGGDHAWSIWLNEGLARSFEEPVLRDGSLSPGPVDESEADLLRSRARQGRLPPAEDLVRLDHAAFHADGSLHYAYAGALARYLMATRWESFLRYYEAERKSGRVSPFAFMAAFGSEDLRPGLLAWLDGR